MERKLESIHDLTPGEKSYLREQSISPEQFDRMSPVEQHEWKDEMRNPHYEHMRRFERKH